MVAQPSARRDVLRRMPLVACPAAAFALPVMPLTSLRPWTRVLAVTDAFKVSGLRLCPHISSTREPVARAVPGALALAAKGG